jgi:MFS family permease
LNNEEKFNMAMAGTSASGAPRKEVRAMSPDERRVIFASSLGTVFEWYDFYLFGVMSTIIAAQFFTALDPSTRDIFTLLAFAAGFAVRPFGAIVFGRLGDLVGRKYTFLVTILIMGLSTFLVAFLPNYASWGIVAPAALIGLRLLQGLALGGEYGGAATYVAEHAPHGRRGAYTAWIQTTATVGLMLALMVILGTRLYMGETAFAEWGWRIPYALSGILLGVSVWIRLKLHESPAFTRMKSEGKTSKAPLTESFGQWGNLKIVILALVGATAGQAVVWYTGQFYALFFLQTFLKVDGPTANVLIALSLIIGTPFFLVFGALSDRIGRKPIIMAGCLIAALTYFPLFHALTGYANPKLQAAIKQSPVTVVSNPAECNLILNLTGTAKFTTACDLSRTFLANAGVNYDKIDGPAGTVATVKVGDKAIAGYDGKAPNAKEEKARFEKEVRDALTAAGYPAKADPIPTGSSNWWMIVAILTIMVIYVTMVYGPIAAMLVEFFPTRIRYTSMSLPYHIGNGWFGGFLPAISFSMVAAQGNIYSGLWYPIIIATMTFIVGTLFVKETKDRDIYAND